MKNKIDLLLASKSFSQMSENELRIVEEASKQRTEGAFIDDLKFIEENREAFESYNTYQGLIPKEASYKNNALKILVVLIILLLVSVVSYVFIKQDAKSPIDYQIAMLPDGTEIQLLDNSSYTLDQNSFLENRRVILNGSAFFDVQHNEENPFIVEFDGGSLQVLGTSFYVLDESKEVLVRDGKVRVSSGIDSKLLVKGEGVSYAGNKLKEINQTPPQSRLFTKTYENVPLEEVLNDLAEFSSLKIHYNEVSEGCFYNGSFELVTVKEALDELSILFDFEFSYSRKEVKILSATCY